MWTMTSTLLLLLLAAWMSPCYSLPTVNPGLFVIMGVRTCRLGKGYCLLGMDCTLDEDFLPDDEGGHCDGLKSAFTPSAHFICCRDNQLDNTTTPAATTETVNTMSSLNLEPRTHLGNVPAHTVLLASITSPPEQAGDSAPDGQTFLHSALPRDIGNPRNEVHESPRKYVDESHPVEANEIHSENHTMFRPVQNQTSPSSPATNNSTENSMTHSPTETAEVISTKTNDLDSYVTVVGYIKKENESKGASSMPGTPSVSASLGTLSTVGIKTTNIATESTPYSSTLNEHDTMTQTEETSLTESDTESTSTPGGTEVATVPEESTVGQLAGVPPTMEVTTETSMTTQQPGCSGDQHNHCWEVLFRDHSNGRVLCHGTFLNADTVLTSAKCIVRLFSHGLEEVQLQGDAARTSSARIKDVLVHEDYDIEGPMAVLNDLGMVRLHPGEDLSSECALCLPHVEEDFMGRNCCSPAATASRQLGGRLLDGQAYSDCGPGTSTTTSSSTSDVKTGDEMAGSALLCGSVLAGVASMTQEGAIFTPTTDHLPWIHANMA